MKEFGSKLNGEQKSKRDSYQSGEIVSQCVRSERKKYFRNSETSILR